MYMPHRLKLKKTPAKTSQLIIVYNRVSNIFILSKWKAFCLKQFSCSWNICTIYFVLQSFYLKSIFKKCAKCTVFKLLIIDILLTLSLYSINLTSKKLTNSIFSVYFSPYALDEKIQRKSIKSCLKCTQLIKRFSTVNGQKFRNYN